MPVGISLDQYIPASSRLHSLDPRTKVGIVAVMMAAVVNAGTAMQLALLAVTVLVLMGLSGLQAKVHLQGLKPFLPLIIITVILELLLIRGEPILRFWHITISMAGLTAAVSITVRLVLALILARLLTLTTPTQYLLDGISRLLKPLARMGLPVQDTVMIMGIALRFIPLLIAEAGFLSRAQAARGGGQGGSWGERARNLLSLLVPLFTSSLRRAAVMAEAMEARGYTGQGRTSLYEPSLKKDDYQFLAGLVVWAVVFIKIV